MTLKTGLIVVVFAASLLLHGSLLYIVAQPVQNEYVRSLPFQFLAV